MSIADIEAMDDISDLRDAPLPSAGSVSWSVKDFRRIIAPFLNRAPKDWPPGSLRIELLSSREYPPHNALCLEEITFLVSSLRNYEENYRDSPGCWRYDSLSVPVQDLHEIVKPLIEAGVSNWTPALIEPAVEILRGRNSVDSRNATAEALEAWWTFQELWVPYVTEHPDLQRKLDPYFIVLDIGGGVPAGLQGHIANYPPAGCAFGAPVPLNGSNFVFASPSRQAAAHFVGTLQVNMPGLRAWITQGNIAAPTYT